MPATWSPLTYDERRHEWVWNGDTRHHDEYWRRYTKCKYCGKDGPRVDSRVGWDPVLPVDIGASQFSFCPSLRAPNYWTTYGPSSGSYANGAYQYGASQANSSSGSASGSIPSDHVALPVSESQPLVQDKAKRQERVQDAQTIAPEEIKAAWERQASKREEALKLADLQRQEAKERQEQDKLEPAAVDRVLSVKEKIAALQKDAQARGEKEQKKKGELDKPGPGVSSRIPSWQEKLVAEKAKREEQERLAAEKAKREEQQKLVAEKAKSEEQEKSVAEKAKREEQQKLAAQKVKREEQERLAAEKAKKEEQKKVDAAARLQASNPGGVQQEFVNKLLAALDKPVIENLQSIALAPSAPSSGKAIVRDLMDLIAKSSCKCQPQSERISLYRTFVHMYHGMLQTADESFHELQQMAVSHRQNDTTVALRCFNKAKNGYCRVAAVVQHIIDCKFDFSDFKCRDEKGKCSSSDHHVGNVDAALTHEVPSAFRGREWLLPVLHAQKMQTHMDFVYEASRGLEAHFHRKLQECARTIGGKYSPGTLKSLLRCQAKVATDYAPKTQDQMVEGEHIAASLSHPASKYLKDILRGTIVCKDVKSIRSGLMLLGTVSVKDRLQTPLHDVLVNFMEKGLACEVQFHLAPFYALKVFSHGPYEVNRAQNYQELLDAKGNLVITEPHLE